MVKISNISNDLRLIIDTKWRIDKELSNKNDIEITYEWIFLYIVTKFENYIEEIFLWIISGLYKIRKWSKIKRVGLIKFSKKIQKQELIDYLLWDKWGNYLDWLPYWKTEERAKKFLVDWEPFIMTQSEKDLLIRISRIRNFIAHKSEYSYNILIKEISTYNSLHDLFNQKHSWKNTYFDYLVIELNAICLKIKQDLV